MNNKYNNIDELLKESLKDYGKKPSTGVWQKITIRLWLLEKGIYFLIPILIVVFIGAYFLFQNSDSQITDSNIQNSETELFFTEIPDSPKNNETEKLSEIQTKQKQINNDQNATQSLKQSENIIQIDNKTDKTIKSETSAKQQNTSSNNNMDIQANKTIIIAVNSLDDKYDKQNYKYPGLGELTTTKQIKINTFLLSNQFEEHIQTAPFRSSAYSIPEDDKKGKTPIGAWQYGVHIVPELIFTNDETNSKKGALNFDLTGIYTIKDVYFQIGAGIGLSNDEGKFNIDYAQYDSIGYYYEVTGFTINPETGMPIYKTDVENVYDTVFYKQTETTDNYYTYLRIPAFVGLQVHENKGFSISLKAGGTYSLLINKKESEAQYTNNNATSIKITDETNSRIQSNFQLSIGMGFAYQIRNKLSISAEPTYNYYINQVYLNSLTSKTPWSIGLRTGIIFKF